ncbi:MAG: type II/IV secretion system protein [Planctomycetaceae bacterium]|nr:type II/IV secretion system protein [Planctomycetaceae bacterium]
MSSETESAPEPGDVRQKALQEELRSLVDVVGPAPLVDLLLERAFQLNATDLHLDPMESGLRVRLRVDGLLHDVLDLPPGMTPQIISRLKLMANMDITERRLAQDGHISNATLRNQRDIRVGSGSTIYGERLVLRLMPDHSSYTRLDELGMTPEQIEEVQRHVRAPYGMILSVGPVGSGKSTTMYACLELLNDPTSSLVTIEDPVERRMSRVNQIQVDSRVDFGFVEALRGVLRQDPDVMMIGEIRDPETAHIGCRAGLTGVMVLSTLHANNTASTIDVFREFGIPPMFIADAVNCIISQRLVRKICQQSRESYKPDPAACAILGIDPESAGELIRGIPSDANFNTGYSGRTGVFEVLTVSRPVRDAILQGRSQDEILQIATEGGMCTLEQSIRRKVLAGETSLEEMHRMMAAYSV